MFLASLLFALCCFFDPAPAEASFGFSEPLPVRKDALHDPRNDYNTSVATDGKGTWIICWYAFGDPALPIGGDGDILYVISKDNGSTWSEPGIVNTDALSDGVLDVGQKIVAGPDGKWVVAWFRRGGNSGSDYDLFSSMYHMDTEKWNDPTPLNSNANDPADADDGVLSLAVNAQGALVCAWHSQFPGREGDNDDPDVFFSTSDDGENWSPARPLNGAYAAINSSLDSLVVPQVAAGDNGEWIVTWTSRRPLEGAVGSDRDILFSKAKSPEFEWTYPAYLNTNAPTDSGEDGSETGLTITGARINYCGAGHWLCVWASTDSLGGRIGADEDILFAVSDDDAQSWSAPQPLNSNAATDPDGAVGADFAPAVCVSGDGNILVAWTTKAFSAPSYQGESIAISRSTDFGHTWTPIAPLNANAAQNPTGIHQDASIATDGAGRWLLTWTTSQPFFTGGDYDDLMAISRDVSLPADPSIETQDTIRFILLTIMGLRDPDPNRDGRIDVSDLLYLESQP